MGALLLSPEAHCLLLLPLRCHHACVCARAHACASLQGRAVVSDSPAVRLSDSVARARTTLKLFSRHQMCSRKQLEAGRRRGRRRRLFHAFARRNGKRFRDPENTRGTSNRPFTALPPPIRLVFGPPAAQCCCRCRAQT